VIDRHTVRDGYGYGPSLLYIVGGEYFTDSRLVTVLWWQLALVGWERSLLHHRSWQAESSKISEQMEGCMESKIITISEMDEQVRSAISQAREQLSTDKECLASLDELICLWNDLCYRLVMTYMGLSLMKLVNVETARSIFQIVHGIIPENGRTQFSKEIAKSPSGCLN
jgi:hypothetical protein